MQKWPLETVFYANSCVHSRRLIAEFPEYGIKCLENLQSHCANMTFADKSRYDRTFQQVTRKGGESSINCIEIFKNTQALSISVGNSYSEDQIMHTFLDHFHQSGKYSAQLASHQAKLRREELYPDQKCLNISSLQTEYLNLDNSNSESSKHSEKANSAKTKCTYCGLSNHSVEKCFKKIRKEKEKARSAGTSSNKNSDRPARKCFRCVSEDHLIAKCPNPPKDSEKRRMSDKSKEKDNSAKDNSDDDNDLKVYASMERMSNDDVSKKKTMAIVRN